MQKDIWIEQPWYVNTAALDPAGNVYSLLWMSSVPKISASPDINYNGR